jgi:hypothetical protein
MNTNVNNNNNNNNVAAKDNGMINNNPSTSNNNNDDPSELVGDNNNWMADNNPSELNNNYDDPLAVFETAPNAPNNDNVMGMEDAAAAADDDDTNSNIYMVNGIEHQLPPGSKFKHLFPFMVMDETTHELKAGLLNAFDYMGLVTEPQNVHFDGFEICLNQNMSGLEAAKKVLMDPALRKCEG